MSHTIVVSSEFFFKGEKLSPSMVIDLESHVENLKTIESLFPLLAKHNKIDLYSYEYEILQEEILVFSDATGLAASFLDNGKFNLEGFLHALREEKIHQHITDIAKEILSIDDLSSHATLRTALIEAYKLGQKST